MVLAAYDNFTQPKAISRAPLWVFQGDEEQSVPLDRIREMMNANLRYTGYHKVDHDVWDKGFAEPDLVLWLSSQRRGKTPQDRQGTASAVP